MIATSLQSSAPRLSPYLSQFFRKYAPLIIIIALHIAFFYALRSGLVHQVAKALPREIFVNFITEEPAPQPQPRPEPVKPKTVPVVKKQITRPTPRPIVEKTPLPQAITEELPPPQESNEPPAVAAPATPEPAAASATVPATPKMISGVSYINAPRPVYPPLDARMGNEGTVTLRVLINEKGRAEQVEIQKSSGSMRLDDAAREAVLRALFKPYLEDGRPTPAYAIVPINFTLNR